MKLSGPAILLLLTLAAPARADERHFTYSNEAQVLPSGVLEFEQWLTLRARREAGILRTWILREEVEYGVTDDLTTAVYLNWEYATRRGVPDVENEHELELEGVSNEWKVRLLHPSIDPIGLLLYVEASAGEDELELECKLVLHKHLGAFHLVYNLVFEAEREKEDEPSGGTKWETEYQISNTVGLSWQAGPGVAIGVEALSRIAFEGSLHHSERPAYYAGPNIHYARARWWATATALRQVDIQESGGLDVEDREKYEFRLIVGFTF